MVEAIEPGRVMTYAAVADAVGLGGPRQVGRVMGQHGDSVPWWRVVYADGSPPTCHEGEAAKILRSEGTPMLSDGRVDLRTAAT